MELRFMDRLDVLQAAAANSAVFTPQSAGGSRHALVMPILLHGAGSELRSGPQAYETVTHFPTSMQDGELALLHRSLTKPAEMDTNHPSLTQANRPAHPDKHFCFLSSFGDLL